MTRIIIILLTGSLFAPAMRQEASSQDDKKKDAPTLTAKLVDEAAKSKKKEATVEATVSGLEIVDPASVKEVPKAGQGHLHYQFDDGPVIATTVTKLSFHMLKPGKHTIKVTLAGNDHKSLGQEQTLTVDIPAM